MPAITIPVAEHLNSSIREPTVKLEPILVDVVGTKPAMAMDEIVKLLGLGQKFVRRQNRKMPFSLRN
jgi:hypothetical protein